MNYLKYLNVPNKSNANTQHHQSQGEGRNLQVFFVLPNCVCAVAVAVLPAKQFSN